MGSTTAGVGSTAANTSDPDWDGQAGTGGYLTDGGSGLIVIYYGASQLISISPKSGTSAGGTLVTLKGTGFSSGTTVTVGGATCSGVAVQSSYQLTCVTPATGSLGLANVVVNVPHTLSAVTLANGFTYF